MVLQKKKKMTVFLWFVSCCLVGCMRQYHGQHVTREIKSSLLVFIVLLIKKIQNKLRRKLKDTFISF